MNSAGRRSGEFRSDTFQRQPGDFNALLPVEHPSFRSEEIITCAGIVVRLRGVIVADEDGVGVAPGQVP